VVFSAPLACQFSSFERATNSRIEAEALPPPDKQISRCCLGCNAVWLRVYCRRGPGRPGAPQGMRGRHGRAGLGPIVATLRPQGCEQRHKPGDRAQRAVAERWAPEGTPKAPPAKQQTQEGGEAGRRLRMWAPSRATAGPPARVRTGMERGKAGPRSRAAAGRRQPCDTALPGTVAARRPDRRAEMPQGRQGTLKRHAAGQAGE
jgi:hypothetical protein